MQAEDDELTDAPPAPDSVDDQPYDSETDPEPSGLDGKLNVRPGPGGYAGRDPATEMPRMPTDPETQDDPENYVEAPPNTDPTKSN